MKSILFVSAALLLPAHLLASGAPGSAWHQEPFRLKAGEELLDTYVADIGGHAAPFLADLDGDGRRDLTVGSIRGQFHFYRNIGTDAAPRFAGKPTLLMAGAALDEPAQIPNFCCVASGPQLRDIDGDGILDLAAGSYSPGSVYWFKGRGNGTFHARHMLTDMMGRPVLPVPEVNPYEIGAEGQSRNMAVNLAWTNWDDNSSIDLLLGNAPGQLFVRMNIDGIMAEGSASSMPIGSQPQFMHKGWQKVNEITIDGGVAVPGGHAAPAVADWDGDGLWDILSGSMTGEVYWFRNTGKPGAPEFKERHTLLDAGRDVHWVQAGAAPGHGTRTQIQAVDYNLDGKLDLLVGEWSIVRSVRPDLTRSQRRQMARIEQALKALDAKVDFRPELGGQRYQHFNYYQKENEPLLNQAKALEKQLTAFLVRFDQDEVPDYMILRAYQRYTGYVWVYLRK